ncbi:ABC transporter ATP-binding protein [Microbacterium sp. ASV49]|uniref:ABC transporter ATP-binding protein n=1 Tax=Microbacterium candidum TaxID=3041922 RepID=A0ABT7MTQ2_9MICO|nr:ABC transporter ATP-binding protein [Microbacterium sp. ASV49]MDL9977834.1 ABC transporter ATP-binding protein [Microbacterium sp. ASV49]
MTLMEPAILCTDLVRIYSTDGVEVQALQGLNLRVDPAEMVAIVGASGSGKSTLLGIVSGLDKPTAGSAVVAGSDLGAMSRTQRVDYRRRTVGFVWQQTGRNLLPYLTAAENVRMARNVAKTQDGVPVDDLLELLEVGDVADRTPAQMSGGQQQRVAIAVALANSPKVLLADEPTGELDEATSAEVLEAMRGVNRELGVTTLIVTHDPTVSEHVRRTVQIRDGRTSTETLRRAGDGGEHVIAEEFAVIDRVGRLQLPREYVSALDLQDRVRLALEPDHLAVWPGHEQPATESADAAGSLDSAGSLDAAGAVAFGGSLSERGTSETKRSEDASGVSPAESPREEDHHE